MDIIRRLLFWLLTPRWDREVLERWKKEGRIPQDYYGNLRDIAWIVEAEGRSKNRKAK